MKRTSAHRDHRLELQGSLLNFSLPDVIQLIGNNRRTGVLVLNLGEDRAFIYFAEGNITHAKYRGSTGQEAINRVFHRKGESFRFLADVDTPAKTVMLDWMGVLMEAARLEDETKRDAGTETLPLEEMEAKAWDGTPGK